ncbi:BnaA02g06530D [Brassica napus]|uniref:BnaA02g06530D protein n=1 Tax=Brassica napus TaxID=3708 RepID=A0A078F7Z3_BRANA|nr:BnaA02g06530D [Brassica napus]
MKRYLCCFKGESSSQGAARNPQSSGGNAQRPFGDNEFLNNAWRNNLELPDDRLPPAIKNLVNLKGVCLCHESNLCIIKFC